MGCGASAVANHVRLPEDAHVKAGAVIVAPDVAREGPTPGPEPNPLDQAAVAEAFFGAAADGKRAVVQQYIAQHHEGHLCISLDAPFNGVTALVAASAHGHVDIVRDLIAAGADLNACIAGQGLSALDIATQNGQHVVCKALLETGRVDPNRPRGLDGCAPLLIAAQRGHAKVVQALIAFRRTHVDVVGPNDATALHLAIQARHSGVALFLLHSDSNPRAAMSDGTTPLILAAKMNLTQVVRELIRLGVDPDETTDALSNMSALQVAVREGRQAAVDMLLTCRANPNHLMQGGISALMLAARQGTIEMVQLLVDHRASLGLRAQDGQTALQMANLNEHQPIVRLLLSLDPSLDPSLGNNPDAARPEERRDKQAIVE